MKTWVDVLRDENDLEMTPNRAREMRRAVVGTVALPTRTPLLWRMVLASVAALIVLIAGAGDQGRAPEDASGAVTGSVPSGERRQIQFSTPGGTRIIWELNPEFSLKETLP
jgi:hypothetical protein